MKYAPPGNADSIVTVAPRYENFIGGKWLAPTQGKYRADLCPATGRPITEVAHSTPEDVELALDAAHAAKDAWGEKSATERAEVLNAIADAIDANKEMLAVAESWENGKPVRETLNADLPLVVDHFRYFAAAARAEEGTSTEIEKDLVAYHFREPLGVVGQIIPFNFPLLMAAWKLAPALAAGNCAILKPASPTPWSILKLIEVIEDVVPPGVINIVTGPGAEIGKALAANPRIAKISFTGETVTGRLIMQYAAQNIIPCTVELGGKSPNIFFSDVMAQDDEFLDKAVEGLVLFAFNKGEVCTSPSRALIQEDIYEAFMARCLDADRRDQAGRPARHRHPARPAGLRAADREDRLLRRDRAQRGRRGAHRWRARRTSAASSPTATSSSRRCSRATTRCASSRRRSSGRSWPSPRSPTTPKRSRSPTTPSTASAPESGHATAPAPTRWAAPSRPAGSGRTATTSTPPGPRSAATRSPASAGRTTG